MRDLLLSKRPKRAILAAILSESGECQMKYLSWALGPVAGLILQVSTANAIPITVFANLSGANEVPPVSTTATGLATVILDSTAQTLQVNATFSGLTSNDVAAHIHCCAPFGTNAGSPPRSLRFLGSLWE